MLVSTRDIKEKEIKSSQAIIEGLSNDGGLFVKKDIPFFNETEFLNLSKLDYYHLAAKIISRYLDDLDEEEVLDIIKESYNGKFDIDELVNLNKTKDCFVLELYHGPTCAFKDMALLVLPNLLKKCHEINNDGAQTIILTATSGDTGSSALNGFKDDKNTKMIVFYPTSGVSAIQERQMLDLASIERRVIAIDGNFDDAQRLVKKIFNDDEIKKESNAKLSSANSINIGRLLPQIVYYFKSYFDLVERSEISIGEKINFSVPTGNFGDILAGFLAMKMGLPVNKLICASNENNVLTDFFNNKKYDKKRVLHKTISPSMDILVSSNLERLLYYVTKSPEEVKKMMDDLDKYGEYEIDKKYDLSMFDSFYLTETETKEVIKKVYEDNHYLIDTHTAVGYGAYLKYQKESLDKTKTIVLSTAHPYKFPLAILNALGMEETDEFTAIDKLESLTGIKRPEMINKLNKEYKKTVFSKDEAYNKTKKLIEELNYV